MPKLWIDGREIEAAKGSTILQVAKANGIRIPYYCWHPHLSIAGNCRICLVEVEGMPKLATACSTVIAEGMKVTTASDKVIKARRGVMEFLLLHHPIDCPICDQAGECKLQDYYMEHGLHDSRMPLEDKLHKPKVCDLGPIMYDGERCILCTRCVRFMREVAKSEELGVQNRGNRDEIATHEGRPLQSEYSCNAADICPVGALTIKDFRFKCRVWFLKSTPSVCPTCSTGCNIRIEQNKNVIYRYLPRDNPAVNQTWICNEGRFSYKRVQDDTRVLRPRVRRDGGLVEVGWEEAIALAASKIKDAGAEGVAGMASQDATNEDDYYFMRFIREVIGSPHLDYRLDDSHDLTEELEDHLFRRKDKHPNSRGAADIGCAPGPHGLATRGMIRGGAEGRVKVLYLLQSDPLGSMKGEEFIRSALERSPFIIAHTTHETKILEFAHLVLPACTHAEVDGTFTNFQGRVQRVRRAIEPQGEARPGWMILNSLCAALGSELKYSGPEAIFKDIAATVERYRGLDYDRIGLQGIVPDEVSR